MYQGTVPELVMVMVCTVLTVPACCAPKLRLLVDIVTIGPGVVLWPVPVKAT